MASNLEERLDLHLRWMHIVLQRWAEASSSSKKPSFYQAFQMYVQSIPLMLRQRVGYRDKLLMTMVLASRSSMATCSVNQSVQEIPSVRNIWRKLVFIMKLLKERLRSWLDVIVLTLTS